MADVLTPAEPPQPKSDGGETGIPTEGLGDFGGGGDGGDRGQPFDTAQIGLWVLLGSLTMLFASFTSAYLVRRTGSDWAPLAIPPILWVSTAVLLASSVTMEAARRSFRRLQPLAFRKWALATFLLGSLFLLGQLLAWRQLAEQGIYLHSHPHSSFFYVLTGVHAVHIVAGVVAVLYVLAQSWRYRLTPGASVAPGLCATYWHFVDGVWLYLFGVLFLV